MGETDVYLFAGISGDFAPIHVDEEFMKTTKYGRRIAHGALMIAYMSQASTKMCAGVPGTIVSYGYDRIRFPNAVFIGDTVTVTYEIAQRDEAARVLRRLAADDEKAKPRRQFDKVIVQRMTAGDFKEVAALLGVDAKTLEAPKARSPRDVDLRQPLAKDTTVKVEEALKGERPVTVRFGKVSLFTTNPDYDVVKVDVESAGLHGLNKKVSEAQPNTETHPEYKPHVTIAYVRKGKGAKYVGNKFLEGQTVTLDSVIFSGRDGIIKTTLAEIEIERRAGYNWYGTWPREVVDTQYPAWKQRIK